MKILYCFVVLLISVLSINSSYSQPNPTYTLTATNFQLLSINYPDDALTFDIYLLWTNSGVSQPFEYSSGQYFLTFNRNIMTNNGQPVIFPNSGADTSKYSYKIIGSTFPTAAVPRGPSFQNTTSNPPIAPELAVLRLATNATLGCGSGPTISSVYPGTMVVRMRLWNKQSSFNIEPLLLVWRNPNPAVDFVTRVLFYASDPFCLNTDITTPGTHYIDEAPNFFSSVQLLSPTSNSIDNPLTNTFVWKKKTNAISYKLKIFSDSLYSTLFFVDSTITDTFKNVSGFEFLKKYYWEVEGKDSLSFSYSSPKWQFATREAANVNITVIPEGMYYPLFNQLSRRDTVSAYLRKSTPPYNIIDSAKAPIDSLTFTGLFKFKYAESNTYYIAMKHFNCIETWSKSGGFYINETAINNYDFTTAKTQAYGDNIKLKGSKYCMYSGDVSRDGVIDVLDFSYIDNDAFLFRTGLRLRTDLNGDNVVDLIDIQIADNNRLYISVQRPY